MAPVTQEEVDRLMDELDANLDDEAKREALGVKAYTELFTALPQHIDLFSRLRGLDAAQAIQSEDIKYYGLQACDGVLKVFRAAADDKKLSEILEQLGNSHVGWKVTRADFLSTAPGFTRFFKAIPQITENKATMEKIMTHYINVVGNYLE
ncbi:unnamed protein product [Dicrocoelium dendriticum]|nr:unnamed protein product [Dicrocoelium dendriticum]